MGPSRNGIELGRLTSRLQANRARRPAALDRRLAHRYEFADEAVRRRILTGVREGQGRTAASERLATTFSPTVFRALAKEDVDTLRPRVAALARMDDVSSETTLGQAFDMALAHLSHNYRNEYYFKSQLVSKVIFGRHSPRTASALVEVPMGRSCADLMILNGTSSVYEIKTDLDDFARLAGQLESYMTRADRVHVVVSDSRAKCAE